MAANEVLSTPKLLSKIFSFSERIDNASSFLVNKTWAEEVLKIEWSDVDLPKWLFGLAPLELNEDDFHVFSRPLESADWERFYRYAPKVKVLIQDCDVFDDSVYDQIADTQPHDVFLPNLEHLCCPIGSEGLDLFLYPGLTSLTLATDGIIDYDVLEWSYSTITENTATSLEVLFFNYDLEDSVMQASQNILASTLSELKTLTSVTIPPHWLTETVTQALAGLPALKTLDTLELDGHMDSTELDATLSPSLNSDSFPSLGTLSLFIPFENAIPGFVAWGGSVHLHSLAIESNTFESPESYNALVKVIVRNFPYLCEVYIDASKEPPSNTPPPPRLTFEALKPLISLEYLNDLNVSYVTPLLLHKRDLFDILLNLEYITSLVLNPTPPIQTPSTLHLSCLVEITFLCSPITKLGLYVDTSSQGFTDVKHSTDRLGSLDILDLGYSVVSREAVVRAAEYLSMLSEWCVIQAESPDGSQRGVPWEWKKVSELVPVFREAIRTGDVGELHRLRIVEYMRL